MADSARTRFAPSPTGSLHVGGARTALYCLLHARHTGGSFLLRIEDTDRARSTDESTRGILRDLRWLGLEWDEGPERDQGRGPYFQSERLPLYDQVIDQLLASGRAYEAWETRAEIAALRRAAEASGGTLRYRRRPWTEEDLARFRAEGRQPVIRLVAGDHDVVVHDDVVGDVVMPAEDRDDLVIRKADGFPTYHLAVVVDDHHMEITQVLRGQEHLMNTPKHLGILEALGWDPPRFGHLPLIFNPEGSKMSKRDKAKAARVAARRERDARTARGQAHQGWEWLAEALGLTAEEVARFMAKKSDSIDVAEAIAAHLAVELPMIEVMDFRRRGYLPEALINYLGLLGWSPGDDRELLDLDQMIEAFTLDRVKRTPARFDTSKLGWMSGEYMRGLPLEVVDAHLVEYLEVSPSPLAALDASRRRAMLEMYRGRSRTFGEMDQACRFFFTRPESWQPKAVRKHLLKGGGVDRLRQGRVALEAVQSWDEPSITTALEALAEALGVKLGKVAQPLRIAVSGGPVSPPIHPTLAFLPQDEVLARIDACLAHLDHEP